MRAFVQANTRTKRDRLLFYTVSGFIIACFFAVLCILSLFRNPSGMRQTESKSCSKIFSAFFEGLSGIFR